MINKNDIYHDDETERRESTYFNLARTAVAKHYGIEESKITGMGILGAEEESDMRDTQFKTFCNLYNDMCKHNRPCGLEKRMIA